MRIHDLLATEPMRRVRASREDVHRVTRTNAKRRFETGLIDGTEHVRAAQSHSAPGLDDEAMLERLQWPSATTPEWCVHGTYQTHVEAILAQGLRAGGEHGDRLHIQFAPVLPGVEDVRSGVRTNCEVAIWVNLRQALEDGVPFYRSTNGVILTRGVNGTLPVKYIREVTGIHPHKSGGAPRQLGTPARRDAAERSAPAGHRPETQPHQQNHPVSCSKRG